MRRNLLDLMHRFTHRFTHRFMLGIACWIASGAAWSDDAAELSRIRSERQQIEARYSQANAACASEFAVSACQKKARELRRTALEPLRRQQITIDDARRSERAAQRRADVARKQAAAADQAASAPAAGASQAKPANKPSPKLVADPSASAPGAAHLERQAGRAPAPPNPPRAHRPPVDLKPATALAAQRAADSQRRRAAAEQHRLDVELRNREAQGKRPPAAGLPTPSASGNSR